MPDPISLDARSPRHQLPYLFAAQAQKEFLINETVAKLDCLLTPQIAGEEAAPPLDPTDGDCFIVAAPASGEWAGRAGDLACWVSGQWLLMAPISGMTVFDTSTSQFVTFINGWQRASTPVLPDGGSTVDTEARAAIGQLVAILENTGVLSQT